MVDFLIIRNKCDEATRITNWLGDGLKPYLESQGYSVTDLSDNDATPENVNHWLNFNNMNVTKCVIALDHGSNDKFFGELNDKITDVININNVESLTKQLHIYTVACSTNAPNGLGENAIKKGCFSWLGYIDIVYVIQSQSFKDCIWTYIKAIAEGKTLEQCEQTLRDAYKARVNESFVYQYNLDRLLLRKKDNNMTIKTNYRPANNSQVNFKKIFF